MHARPRGEHHERAAAVHGISRRHQVAARLQHGAEAGRVAGALAEALALALGRAARVLRRRAARLQVPATGGEAGWQEQLPTPPYPTKEYNATRGTPGIITHRQPMSNHLMTEKTEPATHGGSGASCLESKGLTHTTYFPLRSLPFCAGNDFK